MDPISIIGFIALVVGGGTFIFSRVPKETIKNQKELIGALQGRLDDLEERDANKEKQLNALIAKVDVLATIPLADIASAIKEIVKTQKEIVEMIHDEIQRKKENENVSS